jgi:hemerythrin-like domain-containing protein
VGRFIEALQRHLEVENQLILESVTTEIGVGD